MLTSQSIKILIVNDDLPAVFDLKQSVETMGFQSPLLAQDMKSARELIIDQRPSIIICDIFVNNQPKSLELLYQFQDISHQFIIATASAEQSFYDESSALGAGGHLIKPFHYLSLRSVIDRILAFSRQKPSPQEPHLFVRGIKNERIRIDLDEILYMYSERNYTFIKVDGNVYTAKISLTKIQAELDSRFIRIHNSYIVNMDYVKSISPSAILIQKDILPLGRAYKKNISDKIKLIQNQ